MSIYTPEFYVNTIYSIDFSRLAEMNIRNLVIDIDNTLIGWGTKDADERVIELIKALKEKGFNICFLSNSSKKRIQRFIGEMGVEFYTAVGMKPMKIMFEGALKILGGTPDDTCIIGDQIFTDIVGGNRCGIHTILVDPISNEEFITTRVVRRVEKNIKKNLSYEGKLIKVD